MPKKGYTQCPACAEWIREGALVCRFCGARLTDKPLPEFIPDDRRELDRDLIAGVEEQFSRMGLRLSPAQQRRIVDFLKQSGEEYRLATCLYVDICEFTRISEELKGEKIRDLLDVFYLIFTQAADTYNGTIVQIAGDGGVAVFGAPRACDRDAEGAVRAALDIRDRIAALPPIHGVALRVRLGLATGEVLSSVSWSQHPPLYKVYGLSMSLAARIENAADPGTIVVDPATHELTAGLFRFESIAPRPFKNVRDPVATWQVVGPAEKGATRRDYAIPFIGRDAERERIEEIWKAFATGGRTAGDNAPIRAGAVVRGEPGIGKTRFLLEFLKRRAAEATVVSVECEPHGAKTPFGLWRSVIGRLAVGHSESSTTPGVTSGEPARSTSPRDVLDRNALDAALSALEPDKRDRVSLYALFGIREGLDVVQSLPPRLARRQLVADLRRLLERAAEHRPVILALDDLQWADPTSLEVLGSLLETPTPRGVFFLLAHRPDDEVSLLHRETFETIPLAPMSEHERRALFNLVADVREFHGEIRDILLDRAEGNPHFLVEMVRSLKRTIEERQGTEAGRLLPSTVREWLPNSLKEMIQSRIDRLDDRRRLVLQCGSVLGRRFAYEIVELFDIIREGLLARLYSLKALEYLDDLVLPEHLEFLFRHDLTREVAYQSLLERRRVEFHRLIAERIEEQFSPSLDEVLPTLAFHYSRSDRDDKAVEYLQRAGNRALALTAVHEAKECFEEALVRLARIEPTRETRLRQIAILVAKARLHRFQGDQPSASRAIQTALPIAEDLNARLHLATIHAEIGLIALLSSDHKEAEASFAVALAKARRLDAPGLLGVIHNGLGICRLGRGDHKHARSEFEKTRSLKIGKANPKLMGDAVNNLALLAWKSGDLPGAGKAFREARGLYAKAGDRFGIAATTMNLGIIEEERGRYRSAETLYRAALESAEPLAYNPAVSAIHANLSSLALAEERFVEAMDHAARAADVAAKIGDRRGEAIALENLALAQGSLGQFRESRAALDRAGRIARAIGDRERLLSLDLALVEISLLSGSLDGTWKRIEAAARVLERGEFAAERPRCLRLTAHAHALGKEIATARKTATLALHEARAQKNRTEQKRIQALAKSISGV